MELSTIQYQCHKCAAVIEDEYDSGAITVRDTQDGLFYRNREIHLCKDCHKTFLNWLDS